MQLSLNPIHMLLLVHQNAFEQFSRCVVGGFEAGAYSSSEHRKGSHFETHIILQLPLHVRTDRNYDFF